MSQISYPSVTPHGEIQQVFEDVFYVPGSVQMTPEIQVSRNMIIVRQGESLSLISAVRLDEDGLKQLDKLGKVENVIKIGAFHLGNKNGLDDAFYMNRYDAKLWALPNMKHDQGLSTTNVLSTDDALPFSNSDLFVFETSKMPEGVIRIQKEGGILISADSLQNFTESDPFFNDLGRSQMQKGGFITPANIGPLWYRVAQPHQSDFSRLLDLEFRHVIPSHGQALLHTAKEDYAKTITKLFKK